MIAHYGYSDGSGEFFIAIDTDRCDGCGACASACPAGVMAVLAEDPNDPGRAIPVALVREEKRKKIRDGCSPCKPPGTHPPPPCVAACPAGAISHFW